jgi:hypothetical protein
VQKVCDHGVGGEGAGEEGAGGGDAVCGFGLGTIRHFGYERVPFPPVLIKGSGILIFVVILEITRVGDMEYLFTYASGRV